jgi:hypothetical protein
MIKRKRKGADFAVRKPSTAIFKAQVNTLRKWGETLMTFLIDRYYSMPAGCSLFFLTLNWFLHG